MTDANLCIPPSGHLKMSYTIMTDADWCIPPCGTFNNATYHHEGCRLVHPAMWDIEQFRFAFMTDAAWRIPPCCSFGISIQFKMSRIDQFVYNSINHSHAINCQHFKYHILKSICTFVITFQRYTYSIQSFQIYLVNYQNT